MLASLIKRMGVPQIDGRLNELVMYNHTIWRKRAKAVAIQNECYAGRI
jgi:hypothetical protein